MNCKKCGTPLMENDQFCKNCGAAVNETNAQETILVGGEPINNVMSEQPLNNYQQPTNNYMNGYNPQAMYNQSPKNNSTKFVLIGLGLVIVVGLALFLLFVFGKNNNSEMANGGSSLVNNKSTYTVNFKGFTFKVPTDLIYEPMGDYLLLGNEADTWAANIEVVKGSYDKVLSNKNKMQAVYQQNGYIASSAVEKKIGGVDFVTIELSKNGQNALLGLSKANSMYVFGLTAVNIDNEYDYDILKTVSTIFSSAEYTGETNNMSTFEKVDMSVISALAQ